MATFYRLSQSNAKDPIYHLFDAINFAQHEREKEVRSATKIQSIIKMKQQRSRFLRVVRAAVAVQRLFRGYQARKDTLRSLIHRDEHRQMQIFHYFATMIQSRFRGFLSRKKVYNYYAQRRYVATVVAKSDEVRKEAQEAFVKQLAELDEKAAAERRMAFEKSLRNKHHLVSTAAVSGVYRPPLTINGVETVFGTALEDELKESTAHALAAASASARKFKKDLPVRSIGGGAARSYTGTAGASAGGDGSAEEAGAAPLKASPPRNAKAASAGDVGRNQPSNPRGTLALTATGSSSIGGGGGSGGSSGFGMMATAKGLNSSATAAVWGKGALAQPPPLSLQSSTPYSLVQEEERHARAIEKAVYEKMHGKGGFTVKKADPQPFPTTVNCETPYVDPKPTRKGTR